MIVGTAGHIDHGKTALVRALTGVDTDRLPEEKARGISLDLGYAYTADGRIGYVDVPGHERLVHNMLAGATGIDFLLLTIAADDGPMPQTREHLTIAQLLNLTRGAVALTKIDVVDAARQDAAKAEVAALLADTAFAGAPLFPVSSRTGAGVAALQEYLDAAAAAAVVRGSAGGFRLAIDRAFSLSGVGLVITGTAVSGQIEVGDTLVVTPPGKAVRVRGLHVQDRPATRGRAGERIAVNIAGDIDKAEITRGMWLTAPRLHAPTQRVQCELHAAGPLRHWMPVHLHLGAADMLGRLSLLEGDTLDAGGTMLAEIVLDRAIGALAHDRFILRDQSATRTLGGGMVIDAFPPARRKRAPERLAALRLMALADPRPALRDAAARRPEGVDLDGYALNRNLHELPWQELDLVMVETEGARLGFDREAWRGLAQRLLAALAAEHDRAPDMIGVERDRLRRMTLPSLARAAFDRLAAELHARGSLAQTGGWLHLPAHRAALAAADAASWRGLQPMLAATPFQPPRVRDMARTTGRPEDAVRALMKRVARVGLAYPVAQDHYFTADAVAMLAEQVDALCASEGMVRAAALRDAIGGGRKVAIHILEFFDRVGYTRRVRDGHVHRQSGAARQWVLQ
jgi:selenocysteine-specific elongation factor